MVGEWWAGRMDLMEMKMTRILRRMAGGGVLLGALGALHGTAHALDVVIEARFPFASLLSPVQVTYTGWDRNRNGTISSADHEVAAFWSNITGTWNPGDSEASWTFTVVDGGREPGGEDSGQARNKLVLISGTWDDGHGEFSQNVSIYKGEPWNYLTYSGSHDEGCGECGRTSWNATTSEARISYVATGQLVPEPGTHALMLAGLVAVGAMLRRGGPVVSPG